MLLTILKCDRCPARAEGTPGQPAHALLADAKARGWSRLARDGRPSVSGPVDLCPACSVKKEAERE